MSAPVRLGVDVGTSNTVAVLDTGDGRARPLLFDASPLLPSAVWRGADALLTGADAERAAVGHPAGLEANPKRRIDEGEVWLGEQTVAVVDLIAAVLRRVLDEAVRVAGVAPVDVVLTHPAAWSRPRLAVLTEAATRAGLGAVTCVPEPVAAAAHFVTTLGRELPIGRCLTVYDLGAGTFDASVVRRTDDGFLTLATAGLDDVGGLDLDGVVVNHAKQATADSAAWGRLDWPQTPADQAARQQLWRAARAAKEQLSRHPVTDLYVPLVERSLHLTRDEFERAARPFLDRTVAQTVAVLQSARVGPEDIAGILLVGGASRVPLAATLLHRGLRRAPTTLDHPELVVAEGSLAASRAPHPTPHPSPASGAEPGALSPVPVPPAVVSAPPAVVSAPPAVVSAPPAVVSAPPAVVSAPPAVVSGPPAGPISGQPVSAAPVSAAPVSAAPVSAQPVSPASAWPAPPPPVAQPTPAAQTLPAGGAPPPPARRPTPSANTPPAGPATPRIGRRGLLIGGSAAVVAAAAGAVGIWRPWEEDSSSDDTGEGSGSSGAAPAATGEPLGRPAATMTGHSGRIYALTFSPDGKTAVTGGDGGEIRFWDATSGSAIGDVLTVPARSTVFSLAISPDGTALQAIAGDPYLHAWEFPSRRRIDTPVTLGADANAGGAVAYAEEGGRFALTRQGRVFVRNSLDFDEDGVEFTGADLVLSVAFNPKRPMLAAGTKLNTVHLWDLSAPTSGYELKGPGDTVYGVAFTDEGDRLAAASGDGKVYVWSVGTRQQDGAPLVGPSSANCLAFTDRGLLAVGYGNGEIWLWDLATRQPRGGALKGHNSAVRAVARNPDVWQAMLGSVSEDGTARMWTVK